MVTFWSKLEDQEMRKETPLLVGKQSPWCCQDKMIGELRLLAQQKCHEVWQAGTPCSHVANGSLGQTEAHPFLPVFLVPSKNGNPKRDSLE